MLTNDHNKQALRFHNVEEGENVPTSVSYADKLPSGVHHGADEGLTDEAVSGRETCNRRSSGDFTEGLQLEAQLSCLETPDGD